MLPDNEKLANLMQQAARGNEAAFSAIVRHFEKIVYNIAMHATRNREDALDVSQEVFMKLWRTAGAYRGECSVASWVIRIARNTALDTRAGARPPANSLSDGRQEDRNSGIGGGGYFHMSERTDCRGPGAISELCGV